MTKKSSKFFGGDDDPPSPEETTTPGAPAPDKRPVSGEVAPGCNEPGTVSPSVAGTSQAPKKEEY